VRVAGRLGGHPVRELLVQVDSRQPYVATAG
jgi:hypothetical protein